MIEFIHRKHKDIEKGYDMKRFWKFLTIGCSLLLVFTMSGCSKNTSNQVTGLVNGVWFATTTESLYRVYVFNDDGTFAYYEMEIHPDATTPVFTHLTANVSGTYTYESGSTKVYVTPTDSDELVYNIDYLNDTAMEFVNGNDTQMCKKTTIDWLNSLLAIQQ